MIRRMVVLTLALLPASPAMAQQLAMKLGYVNSQEILEQDPAARQAQEKLNQELEAIRGQVQQMGQELEQMIQQYEAQQLTLSPQVKDQRQQAILTKREEYQGRVDELEQQAGRRQQEIVQPVMDRINRVIEAMRVEGSYQIIFDVAAGSILAADQSLDLTQEVLRRLQAMQPAAAPDAGAP